MWLKQSSKTFSMGHTLTFSSWDLRLSSTTTGHSLIVIYMPKPDPVLYYLHPFPPKKKPKQKTETKYLFCFSELNKSFIRGPEEEQKQASNLRHLHSCLWHKKEREFSVVSLFTKLTLSSPRLYALPFLKFSLFSNTVPSTNLFFFTVRKSKLHPRNAVFSIEWLWTFL